MMMDHRQRTTLPTLVLGTLLWIAAIHPWSAIAGKIQVGFSPEGSAEDLVIQVIGSAHHDLRMMCYSLTSVRIVKALISAKQQGVDVRVVADQNGNRGKANVAAMNLLTHAGIPLRLDHVYKIQHDKVIVVDRQTVETGSFNYTSSAARANSENVIVDWHDRGTARTYLTHWQSRWNQAIPYRSSY